MGAFADTILSGLFGWLQALVNWLWALIDRGGSAMGAWFLRNWLPLVLILVVGGLLVDWMIWLVRWRPYRVWGTRFRRIGRIFSKKQPDMEAEPAPQEEWIEEAPWEEPVYEAPPTLPPQDTLVPLPGEPYHRALEPGAPIEDAWVPEEPYGAEATRVDLPPQPEEVWEADAYPEDAWAQEEEEEPELSGWQDWQGEEALEPEPDQPAPYQELIPLDEDEEENGDWQEEPEAPLPPETFEEDPWEREEEPVFDDFANRGAPEPPRKRRRWEFPEEELPESAARAETPAEGSEPPMDDIDPLAAYDAPEVMQKMRRPRRRRNPASMGEEPESPQAQEPRMAPPQEQGVGEGGRRRRRRSERHLREEEPQQPEPVGRGRASGSRPTYRGERSDQADFTPEDFDDFSDPYEDRQDPSVSHGERAYLDEEGYDAPSYGDPDVGYDDDDDEDLPDPPDWPKWDEPLERPLSRKERKATKPSLFDRLRGVKPAQVEEEEWDPGDDPEEEPPKPKKKGLFAGLMPQQQEFGQPKPKPRVNRQEAYHDPVYPDKKRR